MFPSMTFIFGLGDLELALQRSPLLRQLFIIDEGIELTQRVGLQGEGGARYKEAGNVKLAR